MKTKDDNELFDENGILKDKSTLRTRMLAMDAKSINDANAVHIHRPGYRFSQKLMRDGDTDREAIIDLYTEYDNRVSNAWKNTPPELPNTPAAPVIDSDFDDEGGDCYSQYDARIRDAWRSK